MGNSQSSTEIATTLLNDVSTTVINNSVSNCTMENTNIMEIGVQNIDSSCGPIEISDLTNDMTVSINNMCLQRDQDSSTLSNEIDSTIDAKAKSMKDGITFSINSQQNASVVTDVSNILRNTKISSKLASCLAENTNLQNIDINNITYRGTCPPEGSNTPSIRISNLKNNIISNAANRCTSELLSQSDISNSLKNVVIADAQAIDKGVDLTTFIVALLFTILGPILLFILVPIFYKFLKEKFSSDNRNSDYSDYSGNRSSFLSRSTISSQQFGKKMKMKVPEVSKEVKKVGLKISKIKIYKTTK